jgi:hypothetical protein
MTLPVPMALKEIKRAVSRTESSRRRVKENWDKRSSAEDEDIARVTFAMLDEEGKTVGADVRRL